MENETMEMKHCEEVVLAIKDQLQGGDLDDFIFCGEPETVCSEK